MEFWVCRLKLVPQPREDGDTDYAEMPDVPYSHPRGWGGSDELGSDRSLVRFDRDLLEPEREELRKRGAVPLARAHEFVPAPPRVSDGVESGLSIDGVTPLPRNRNWDLAEEDFRRLSEGELGKRLAAVTLRAADADPAVRPDPEHAVRLARALQHVRAARVARERER